MKGAVPTMLEVTPVYRQLDSGGRLARFDASDAIPVFLLYTTSHLGSFVFGYSPLYAFVAFASGGVATYFLRTRFEFGLMGVLRFFLHPKHFSAFAGDRMCCPYPGRRRRARKTP